MGGTGDSTSKCLKKGKCGTEQKGSRSYWKKKSFVHLLFLLPWPRLTFIPHGFICVRARLLLPDLSYNVWYTLGSRRTESSRERRASTRKKKKEMRRHVLSHVRRRRRRRISPAVCMLCTPSHGLSQLDRYQISHWGAAAAAAVSSPWDDEREWNRVCIFISLVWASLSRTDSYFSTNKISSISSGHPV